MNIRQKLHNLTLSEEQKLFQKHGITSDKGHLTDLGRRVLLDKLFDSSSDLRADILSDVKTVEAEEVKTSKKSK